MKNAFDFKNIGKKGQWVFITHIFKAVETVMVREIKASHPYGPNCGIKLYTIVGCNFVAMIDIGEY